MEIKTPQFDALIQPILHSLIPHKRECRWNGIHKYCENNFEITNEDIEFFKMFQVPASNYCPTCRRLRRFAQLGFLKFFKRPCDAPGHSEQMISSFSAECPFKVYDYKYFGSDEFDPLSLGRDYLTGVSPMEQLFNLRKDAPVPSFLNRESSSINSDYSSGGRNTKNCYYTSGVFSSEDVLYSNLVYKSKDVVDSRSIRECDSIYDVLEAENLYKVITGFYSKSCSDCYFIFDCRNCSDCFGCVNLRNKRYCIFNEQFTKEEYEEFIKENTPLSYKKIEEFKDKFWNLVKSLPVNASRNVNTQNVQGVLVQNSKNLFDVTDSLNSENVRHCDGVLSHKDSMDVLFSGGNSHHLYMGVNIGSQSSNVKFSISSKYCTDCEFIFHCKNLTNCFMCYAIDNKSYCILNKQYTPNEYWELVDIIKSEMLKRGEYGESMDLKFSNQAYNYSLANISYPINLDLAVDLGAYLAKDPETNVGEIETILAENIPQTIDEVDDSILEKAIICAQTGRPFRITNAELSFYRKMKLPLPHLHPNIRIEKKYTFSPIGTRFYTTCYKCSKDIESIFNPKDNYKLYCEKCYQQEVN
jgi:hypothetical protein